jgi:peptidoglycan/LPS O-acetylase OafA/YrhL
VGVLRLFLALFVVYAHCGSPFGRVGMSAENAVQIFYMISGFYMTLVLRGKYAAPGVSGLATFWGNRLLRIFPAYLVVAGITLFLCIFGESLFSWVPQPALYFWAWRDAGLLHSAQVLWLAFTQATMVGLSSFNFFTLTDTGALVPSAGVSADEHEIWRLLLVPQAWSLSVELYFYMVAPFLVTRGLKVLVGVALGSFALRVGLWWMAGLSDDPWSYRFFPSELMFFMLGAIACHAWSERAAAPAGQAGAHPWKLHGVLALLVVAAVAVGRAERTFGPGHLIAPLATAAAFLALPFLFAATRTSRVDRLLGELSYPVYICHVLIIWIVGSGAFAVGRGAFFLVLAMVLACAFALYRFVDEPIDRLRQARLRARRARAGGTAGVPTS